MRTTRTFVIMDVSQTVYDEIKDKLIAAGYRHAIGDDGELDMDGITLMADTTNKSAETRLHLRHVVDPRLGRYDK